MARRKKANAKFSSNKKTRRDEVPELIPLYKAIRDGNANNVEELLKAGTDINMEVNGGLTPLHVAVRLRQLDCFNLILDRGADVNIADDKGRLPLHYAAETGQLLMLKKLLTFENTINVQDGNKFSPLHSAIKFKHLDCAEELLNAGADVNICDCTNRTPLHAAIENDCDSIIRKLLVLNANLNVQTLYGETPLHSAIVKRNLECMELLLNAGVDIDLAESFDSSPLHYASWGDDRCIWKKLLERKPKTLSDKRSMLNLFDTMLVMGKPDFFVDLLEAGADTDVKDEMKNTLLHMAVYNESELPLKKLLQLDLDIDAQNYELNTALHLACTGVRLNKVLLLLDAGARWDIQNNENHTMLWNLIRAMVFNNFSHAQIPQLKTILERTNDALPINHSNNMTAAHEILSFTHQDSFERLFEIIKLVLLTQKSLIVVDRFGRSVLNFLTDKLKSSEMYAVPLIRVCVERGAYLNWQDCNRIKDSPGALNSLLRDVEFCVLNVANNFNNRTLVELYKELNTVWFVPIESFRIIPIRGSWGIIKHDVISDIERNGYCDVSCIVTTLLSKRCIEVLQKKFCNITS